MGAEHVAPLAIRRRRRAGVAGTAGGGLRFWALAGASEPPAGAAGPRLLFGGLALWLACFLALRVVVVGLRRLGAAGWATADAVAALALGAVLLGPVRATELFIFAGSLLLALAALAPCSRSCTSAVPPPGSSSASRNRLPRCRYFSDTPEAPIAR